MTKYRQPYDNEREDERKEIVQKKGNADSTQGGNISEKTKKPNNIINTSS